MPNFDDLLTACLERDARGLALCTEAGLSINRRDHEQNPLWFLILCEANRKGGHDQRVRDCMTVLWARGLRLDRKTQKGYSLPHYVASSCDPLLGRFLLSLPRGMERFSKHLETHEDPITRQWWTTRMTEAQAHQLEVSTVRVRRQAPGMRL